MKLTPQQKKIFSSLSDGKKLADLFREPGMPPLTEFERWRKQPAFERLYQQAQTQGRIVRDGTLDAPAPATRRT